MSITVFRRPVTPPRMVLAPDASLRYGHLAFGHLLEFAHVSVSPFIRSAVTMDRLNIPSVSLFPNTD